MNSKNILIAIGVLGIGLILYKVLLGFVLPIALFVALGYVLKFLLKGPDSEASGHYCSRLRVLRGLLGRGCGDGHRSKGDPRR